MIFNDILCIMRNVRQKKERDIFVIGNIFILVVIVVKVMGAFVEILFVSIPR